MQFDIQLCGGGETIASREFENKPEAKSIAFYFRQKGFITTVQLKEDIRGNKSYRLLIDWGARQTERSRRMKQEDIEQEANDYANENMRYPGEISYESDIEEMMKCFADAFKAGSNYRINHAWHKTEELPQPNALFLAQIGNDAFDTFIMEVEAERWEWWSEGLDIVRWAYIEDLLPNTEGLNL